MEKPNKDVHAKMLADVEWNITYHTEKLAEAQMQKQILTSIYQPENQDYEKEGHTA
tara:strand:- start:2133 stop:2300 length:168 start_codon:yes stop_codon:yes gene_type:complete